MSTTRTMVVLLLAASIALIANAIGCDGDDPGCDRARQTRPETGTAVVDPDGQHAAAEYRPGPGADMLPLEQAIGVALALLLTLVVVFE